MVLEIRFGVGGTDSKLFVKNLYDAYCKYARSLSLSVVPLLEDDGHIVARVRGEGAGKAFQHEAGKHVVQRVPPTEKGSRKHTSVISVAVLPMKDDVEKELNMNEVEVETTGGHGPGGQHQNKTESAVRAKHVPTGITVFINGRKQHQNRREALRILATKVAEVQQEQVDVAYHKERKSQLGGGGRSAKIRTYNFLKGRAVDHRLNVKCGKVEDIIDKGRFDLLLKKAKD